MFGDEKLCKQRIDALYSYCTRIAFDALVLHMLCGLPCNDVNGTISYVRDTT